MRRIFSPLAGMIDWSKVLAYIDYFWVFWSFSPIGWMHGSKAEEEREVWGTQPKILYVFGNYPAMNTKATLSVGPFLLFTTQHPLILIRIALSLPVILWVELMPIHTQDGSFDLGNCIALITVTDLRKAYRLFWVNQKTKVNVWSQQELSLLQVLMTRRYQVILLLSYSDFGLAFLLFPLGEKILPDRVSLT